MKPNLAAAVDRLIVDCRHPFDGGVHCLSRIDDVETILAELGRGAGEPVAVIQGPDEAGDLVVDWIHDNLSIGTKLYDRPPVAGLAELTDEQILELYLKMDREFNDADSCGFDYRKPVIKAAREFLGKVE